MGIQAHAQILDNEASVDFLKAKILIDTGGAGDYDSYSRSLAKTLGLLTPEQQKEIFGTLPVPGIPRAPSIPGPPGGGVRPEVQERIDRRTENGMPREGALFVDNVIAQHLPLTRDEWAGILAIPEQPSTANLTRLIEADVTAGGPGGPK